VLDKNHRASGFVDAARSGAMMAVVRVTKAGGRQTYGEMIGMALGVEQNGV
jgi:hypothetical protein